MKTLPRQRHLLSALACFVALTLAALAQNDPAPAPAAENTAVQAPSAQATPSTSVPAAVSSTTTSVSAPVEPAKSEPAATAAEPATGSATPATTEGTQSTRRLDVPEPGAAATEAREPEETTEPMESPATPRSRRVFRIEGRTGAPRVSFFSNTHLKAGESAEAVVTIGGNSVVDGEVQDAVVSILGNSRVNGQVGEAVVAVFGNAYVNSEVEEVVAVLGNVELGPKAVVHGDVVSVGGVLNRDSNAVVHGDVQSIEFAFAGVSEPLWIQAFVNECVIKARPLAFAPNLGWAWGIAFGFLVFYVLIAVLFRSGVEKTVTTFETRPGGSILTSLVTLLLTPVVMLLLVVTIVGIAVVPFLGVALMVANLFGRAVMLAWIGRRITKLFGDGPLSHPAFAVLIGGLIVMLLYTIPFVGFITYKTLGFLGLGVVVYTVLRSSRRERVKPTMTPPAGGVRVVVPEGVPVSVGAAAPGVAPEEAGFAAGAAYATTETATIPAAPRVAPSASLPRAGFWIRLGAMMIDILLVGGILVFLSNVTGFGFDDVLILAIPTYAALLWKLKGTTIGGIVCGLRVVRMDGRPLDWATVIVRALACFVSLVPLALGFIWVVIDDERQSWHDKIAGTTVVHSRENMSLV